MAKANCWALAGLSWVVLCVAASQPVQAQPLPSWSEAPAGETGSLSEEDSCAERCSELDDCKCLEKTRAHLYLNALGIMLGRNSYNTNASEVGGGVGLGAGIRLGRYVALGARWTTSWFDRLIVDEQPVLMSFTGELKLYLTSGGPFEVFVLGGTGYSCLGTDVSAIQRTFHVVASGATLELGGGLDMWLDRHWSLGGRLYYRGIFFRDPEPGGYDGHAALLGFELDLTLHI